MLKIENLYFSYQDTLTLENINIELSKGAVLSVIGASGSGKSTLLKLIYGLYDLDSGQIMWKNKPILGPKFKLLPGEEYLKYLAQDFDLMPYITVSENVGAFLSNMNPIKKQKRIQALLDVVELTEFAHQKVQYLSGGQMQRVALARVLAQKPELLLLDEPFSHIDNFKKNTLRRKLFTFLKAQKITCIMATHDTNDVLPYSNLVMILKNGQPIRLDTPMNIYHQPNSNYVAGLFHEVSEIPTTYFETAHKTWFYPHELEVVPFSKLKVQVENVYFKGNHYVIEATFEGGILFFENKTPLDLHEMVYLKNK